MKRLKKCSRCAGTGKTGAPPANKCTECDGTGKAQHFEMIFWKHDQFPYVLASRGFLRDDGTAYCPSYNGCFRPIKVMSMAEGLEVAKRLEDLKSERNNVLAALQKGWKLRLEQIAPWACKK